MAAKQEIRRLRNKSHAEIDDQAWLINCALLVLAGSIVGLVVALSDFEDPRILYNGYARLISVGMVIAGLFAAIKWMEGRMLRRVQFCILISLLAHLWLAVYLHQRYMEMMAEAEAKSRQPVEDPLERVTLPEYHWSEETPSELKSEYEEPVETPAPEDRDPEPIEKQQTERDVPIEPAKPLEVETPPLEQPNPAELKRQELSAPHRDLAAGAQVSRQPWRQQPRPDEPIPQPDQVPPGRPLAETLQPHDAAIARQQPQTKAPERQTFDEPSAEQPRETMRLNRRGAESQVAQDVPATPSPTRSLTRAADVLRTEATVPDPSRTAQMPQPSPMQPTAQEVAQRTVELPRTSPQPTEASTTPVTAPQTSPAISPRRASESQPQVAHTAPPTPTRRPQSASSPSVSAEAVPEASQAEAATAVASLTGPRTEVSREPAAAAPQTAQAAAAAAPQQAVSGQLAVNQPRRAQASSGAELAQATPRPLAGRTTATPAEVPSVTAEVAAAAATESRSQPSLALTDPGGTAVQRQTSPRPRAAASSASGAEVAPMSQSNDVPSVAARRATASQQSPAGSDQSPSVARTLQRQTAGANLPSATVPVEATATTPAVAGAAPGSRLEASARASGVERSSSPAASAAQAAAAGSAELAMGSTPIEARMGEVRGRGDRQPASVATNALPRPARTPANATIGATAADDPGALPNAVAAAGTGQTSAPAVNAQATDASRSGRAVLPAARPAPGSGAEGQSGTSGAVSVAQLSRVSRQEAQATAISGGGTPSPARTTVSQAMPLEGAIDAPPSMAATSTAGRETGSPLEANVGGQQRQVTGLPGQHTGAPAAGSIASPNPQGAPLPQTMARRTQAQTQNAGDAAQAAQPSTLARSPAGVELPAVALKAEDAVAPGAAGIASAAGSQPSRLEEGNIASVGRTASTAPQGAATTAPATAQLAMGGTTVPVLAGRLRATSDDIPSPASDPAAATIGRTTNMAAMVGGTVDASAAPVMAGGATAAAEEAQASLAAGGVPQVVRAATSSLPGGAQVDRAGPSAAAPDAAPGALAMARATTGPTAPPAAEAVSVGPSRTARAAGPEIQAEAAEMAAAAPAAGPATESPTGVVQVAAVGPTRQMTGLPGPANDRPAVEAATEAGPAASTPGTVAGARRVPQGDDAVALADDAGGAPLRRTTAPGLMRGILDEIELQPIAAGEPSDDAAGTALAMANGLGEVSRREGGLPVQIAAAVGPGGLSLDPSPQVGVPSRRARPESELVHAVSRRFIVERSGGDMAIDGAVNEPTQSFQHRDIGRRAEAVRARGGSEGTEKAVELGLDFFARMQFPDGHWSIHKLPSDVKGTDPALGQMEADTAATGLALLSYFGAGYTHTDDKHRDVARRGIDWLVRHQKPNGDLFTGGTQYAWFYSHGIATIALCEAYGMTQDPELREPARKAVQFILESQHPQRGGWRYAPRAETDTSVSGWQLQAMKSAQMAGLDVPAPAFKRIEGWLDMAESPGGRYAYNPFADRSRPEQIDGLRPSLAMTGEGMLMRMYMGRGRDNRNLVEGADWLKTNLPEMGSRERPLRDCYYWYYGTQAMFQMQGEYWPAWNERMRLALEPTQEQTGPWAGSWHPEKPVRDRWGHAGGRVYVTAMHLLMFEVYYRVLPLYQELTK